MPVLDEEFCQDIMMDFDDLKIRGGSGLGTAAVTIFDKSVDMVGAIRRLSHFYTHESCGQCTPCREGTGWMENILVRMEKGEADMEEIRSGCTNTRMDQRTRRKPLLKHTRADTTFLFC